jgi:hypothetical protein
MTMILTVGFHTKRRGAGYSRVGNAPLFSGYDYIGRRVFVTGSRSF